MGPERPPRGHGLVLGTVRDADMTKAAAVTRPGLSFEEKPGGFLIFFSSAGWLRGLQSDFSFLEMATLHLCGREVWAPST